MNDIRRSEKGDHTVYLNIGAWYDKNTGHIYLTLPRSDWFHTTINNKKGSKRCHANLYAKLARALREASVPAPSPTETMDTTRN